MSLKPAGKMAAVLSNVEKLNQDIARFVPPAYQPDIRKVEVLGRSPEGKDAASLNNISFTEVTSFHENYDRSGLPGIWKTKMDNSLKVNVPAGIFRAIDVSHK